MGDRATTKLCCATAALCCVTAALCCATAPAQPMNELAAEPSWSAPDVAEVRAAALAWLAERTSDAAARERAAADWPEQLAVAPEALLDRLAQVLAAGDERAAAVVRYAAQTLAVAVPPDLGWLGDPDVAGLAAANLKLLVARRLTHGQLYDEALVVLADLEPRDVVDPASLLFYRALAHHKLLDVEPCLTATATLLEQSGRIPRRYEAIARLIQADLAGVDEQPLDQIARRMDDIGRRLSLGRAGPKVQQIEDDVIASLDKLIEELEQQRQNAQASATPTPSGTPAQDSMPLGGRGRGDVDRRDTGRGSGWGSLPPKQREEALQQVGRDFPSHYREVIEEYFRRLAAADEE